MYVPEEIFFNVVNHRNSLIQQTRHVQTPLKNCIPSSVNRRMIQINTLYVKTTKTDTKRKKGTGQMTTGKCTLNPQRAQYPNPHQQRNQNNRDNT